jgi:hypothetical protein
LTVDASTLTCALRKPERRSALARIPGR